MGAYKILCIHCADTYPSFPLSKEILQEWHQGPLDSNGKVIYLGKEYANRASLPNDKINDKPIATLFGRGWDRLGYRDLIHRDGEVESLTPYVDDDIITPTEVTWGATGANSTGVHICLEGGRLSKPLSQPPMKGAEELLFTRPQIEALTNYILIETANHPKIKIAGHYMLTNLKNCPNFDVKEFLRKINRESFCFV